jgi:O-antigen/teichoic acid export membrane protein
VIPWHKVFNTTVVPELELSYVVWITGLFICLNFVVGLISSVLHAVQKSSVVVIGQLIFNFLSLVFVFCLVQFGHSSLILLALLYGVALISSNILLSAWFYKKNPNLTPRFTLSFQHVKPLLGHGAQFFVLQIAVLVIFTTDKIIISQIFGPEYVTSYDVIFKLFAIVTLVYGLISAPVWSSYTEAFHQSDYVWIGGALRKQLGIFLLVVIAVVGLIFCAQEIIALWVGSDILAPMSLVVSVGLFVLISTWNNIYASFLNGIGRIKIQMYTAIIAMTINVPMAIQFAKYLDWGISGVVLATCLSLMLFGVAGPLETYRTLQRKGV